MSKEDKKKFNSLTELPGGSEGADFLYFNIRDGNSLYIYMLLTYIFIMNSNFIMGHHRFSFISRDHKKWFCGKQTSICKIVLTQHL